MQGMQRARRIGEWLEIPAQDLCVHTTAAPPGVGTHPHEVRKWLLTLGCFSERAVNRLFAAGAIAPMQQDAVRLKLFADQDVQRHPLLAEAKAEGEVEVERGTGDGDKADPEVSVLPAPALSVSVLYEDVHCLVAAKPAGMPVHPARPGQRGTLDAAVLLHLLRKGESCKAQHIHRLDEDTSGPVLYAKHELAQQFLDEAMRFKRIDRQYLALVEGKLAQRAGVIRAPIGKDRHHASRRRVSPGGQEAVTHYECLEQFSGAALVRVRLETGRTHQIRVHFSHIGHPLLGDSLYGGSVRLLSHQALHGERLSFPCPWRDAADAHTTDAHTTDAQTAGAQTAGTQSLGSQMQLVACPLPAPLEVLLRQLRKQAGSSVRQK